LAVLFVQSFRTGPASAAPTALVLLYPEELLVAKDVADRGGVRDRLKPVLLVVIQVAEAFGEEDFDAAAGGVDAYANFLGQGDEEFACRGFDFE
jgi:hypothetical protein